jgi:hypothetical protein
MSVLALTPEVKARCAAIVAYAREHIITDGAAPPVGDNPEHVVEIPFGFRAVFSYELQHGILCRHLSISVDKKDRLPSEHAVHLIAGLFGFTNGMEGQNVTVWVEHTRAINLIEPYAT